MSMKIKLSGYAGGELVIEEHCSGMGDRLDLLIVDEERCEAEITIFKSQLIRVAKMLAIREQEFPPHEETDK